MDTGQAGTETGATAAGGGHATTYDRMARDADRRVLAGVCTGLGRYSGIDPVVFRVGFAVLVLAHGQGVLLYVAAVLLMPGKPGESSLAEQFFKRWFDAQAVLSILGALLAAGVVFSVFGGLSADAIAVLVVCGLVLLVARSRGVDLVAAARSVPERLTGHPPEPAAWGTRSESVPAGGVSLYKDGPPADTPPGVLPGGMIDLAAYGTARAEAQARADAEPAVEPASEPAVERGPVKRRRGERGASPVTAIALLAAMAAGAAMIPVADRYPAPDSWLIVMAPALAVIGFGLVLGGWVRTRGLATAGTVLTLALLSTSVAGEAPRNAEYGEIEWRPTDVAQTNQVYRVGVGQGELNLTALPMAAGERVSIDARVALGGLRVTVPPTARVLLDARISLGDLRIGERTTSGPYARAVQTLEPEVRGTGEPPVIVLRIRGKVGDVDVRRG
ncbi:PspC domain-containing protein [Actinomadura decatromicini]|uniref:PspC domain-containing protein n=1 Tax=Actinomadura decatromicini TaxID=2604572 RepID=A0A5D3F4X7_9ACTN|nr:PspC domain-containing protein [Actinomadura decatromicini]TYK43203.1 PspC domain-containing protein [Actinomadura decatromicini]